MQAPADLGMDVDGQPIEFSQRDNTIIMFFRFASCPFCNMRLRAAEAFAQRHSSFQIVGVFGSPANAVKKVRSLHGVSFPLISDPAGRLYGAYGLQKSVAGIFLGVLRRFPLLMNAMFRHGLFPTNPHGHLFTMPAEFVVDSSGLLTFVYYGKDEGDHVPLDQYEVFLP